MFGDRAHLLIDLIEQRRDKLDGGGHSLLRSSQGCTLSTSVEEVHDHDKKASKHYDSYWFARDFFFFKDTATTEIYTLSLHDALPISLVRLRRDRRGAHLGGRRGRGAEHQDRKSTRLNSSHVSISYAVFCLRKKI